MDVDADYMGPGRSSAKRVRVLQHVTDTWHQIGGRWMLASTVVLDVTQWLDNALVDHRVATFALPEAEAAPLVPQLKHTVIPLRSALPTGSLADLHPLESMIGGARVVGMGEGTHGTSEFFSMKDRLFRFMVEKMGFTVFAMEANWTDGLKIEEYVTTGRGDIRKALASTFAGLCISKATLHTISAICPP